MSSRFGAHQIDVALVIILLLLAAISRAYTLRGWLHYFTPDFGADWATAIENAGADWRGHDSSAQ